MGGNHVGTHPKSTPADIREKTTPIVRLLANI
jgi:hypothetical protein